MWLGDYLKADNLRPDHSPSLIPFVPERLHAEMRKGFKLPRAKAGACLTRRAFVVLWVPHRRVNSDEFTSAHHIKVHSAHYKASRRDTVLPRVLTEFVVSGMCWEFDRRQLGLLVAPDKTNTPCMVRRSLPALSRSM